MVQRDLLSKDFVSASFERATYTEELFKKPVIVTDYPKEIKACYMRSNEDGKTVAAMDVLALRIGEIIGGSQREERHDLLQSRIRDMAAHGMNEASYWWYLDLRRFRSRSREPPATRSFSAPLSHLDHRSPPGPRPGTPRRGHGPLGHPRAKYLPQIAATCQRIADSVEQTLAPGAIPVVLGGDHSVAVGTVSGVSHHFRKRDQSVGLIWLDAHADMNTPESSPSGNVHGMPLACIVGRGPPS